MQERVTNQRRLVSKLLKPEKGFDIIKNREAILIDAEEWRRR
jgi:hypothetical protein